MYRKSRFKSSVLSLVPGLGHIYMGLATRGIIFMCALFSIGFILHFLDYSPSIMYGSYRYSHFNGYRDALQILIPVIWLGSIIDNIIITTKANRFFSSQSGDITLQQEEFEKSYTSENKKLVSILLNVIPGAGHIYIGYKNKGINIMGIFFILYFLTSFIGLDVMKIVIPLIWLYGVFDVIDKLTYDKKEEPVLSISPIAFIDLKSKLPVLGGLLIFSGIAVFTNRIAYDFLDEKIFNLILDYGRTAIISIIFIWIGIRMVMGYKKKDYNREEV